MDLLHPDYESSEYLINWIRTSWLENAARCYEGFLREGRGALFVDLRNATPSPDFLNGLRARVEYCSIERVEEMCAEWPKSLPPVIADLYRYDPQTEAAFMLSRRKGLGYNLMVVNSPELTPKQAYERREVAKAAVPELRGQIFGQG